MPPANKEVVSYSELDAFRNCPLKWKLQYEQRWTKELADDDKRSVGTLWHLVMETHYRTILTWQEAGRSKAKSAEPILLRMCAAEVAPLLYDTTTGKQSLVQAKIEWMYQGYVNLYGADLGWTVLAIEENNYIPLPSATGGTSNRYVLRVTIDLVVKDALGKVWIVDHKSGANLPTKRALEIDDQFGLYTWAARQLGFKAIGAIHSAARTQRNKGDENGTQPMLLTERFGRTTMFRSDKELDNIAADAARAARESRAARNRPVYSSPDPMRCGWKCDMLEPHLAMRRGIKPSVALKDFGFHQAEFNHTERPDK